MEEDLYQRIKARLLRELRAEAPALLKALAFVPELEVTVQRQTLEIDNTTLRGRLAQLVAEGFFTEPRSAHTAFVELKRLGVRCSKPNVYKEADALARLGIVTKEKAGYQQSPEAIVRLRKVS